MDQPPQEEAPSAPLPGVPAPPSPPRRVLRARPSTPINYAEDEDDLLLDPPPLPAATTTSTSAAATDDDNPKPKKRARSGEFGGEVAIGAPARRRHVSEAELEEKTAAAVGLNPGGVVQEEECLLPPGSDEEDAYVKIRNHILAKWRADVSRWLTEEEAGTKIMPRYRHLVSAAWRFLTMHGYMNFGVAPDIAEKALRADDTRGTVIVVGAGLAGLGAARQLRVMGYRVVVVEGRNRLGGRVFTKRMEANGHLAVADLGGSVISGIDGNPLAVLAKQLRIPMHQIQDHTPFYLSDGTKAQKKIDDEAEATYNTILDSCGRLRNELGPVANHISLGTTLEQMWNQTNPLGGDPLKRHLVDWHFANLEFANAAKLETLSLGSWDQDDPYEFQGSHVFLPGCNLRLVAALAEGLPIFYNSVVHTICYSAQGVAVYTQNTVFKGDAVLLTVPLGALKRNRIRFQPPLSERKMGAINRLGFGVLNKVVMMFSEPFWDESTDMFGHVADSVRKRGRFFLFYSYSHISGSAAVLTALIAGQAAEEFEVTATGVIVEEVMTILRRIFEPRGVKVPPPLQAVCTRWGRDDLTFGSYSSVAVGSNGREDYDIMAESIGGRLFWAGEATTHKYPATMHGAYMTGLREAANVAATLEKEKEEARRREGGAEGANGAASEGVERAVALRDTAMSLRELFVQGAVNLTFGCFSAVFGAASGPFSDRALIQVDIGRLKGDARQLPIYLAVTRDQVLRLRGLEGDALRLRVLTTDMSVTLMGRADSNEEVSRLADAILAERRRAAGGAEAMGRAA